VVTTCHSNPITQIFSPSLNSHHHQYSLPVDYIPIPNNLLSLSSFLFLFSNTTLYSFFFALLLIICSRISVTYFKTTIILAMDHAAEAHRTDLMTIMRHVLNEQSKYPESRGDFTILLSHIVLGCKFVCSAVNKVSFLDHCLSCFSNLLCSFSVLILNAFCQEPCNSVVQYHCLVSSRVQILLLIIVAIGLSKKQKKILMHSR
jgi:hypothetical protein